MAELLELEGHKVVLALDGKEGIELAESKQPNIILSDINMPRANGYEVLKELRRKPSTNKIPFIFLTSSTEPREVEKGLNLGAVQYIRKPYFDEELLDALKRWLPGYGTD